MCLWRGENGLGPNPKKIPFFCPPLLRQNIKSMKKFLICKSFWSILKFFICQKFLKHTSLGKVNVYLFTNNNTRSIVINFHLITKIFLFQKMHLKTLPSLKKRTKFLRQQVLLWSWWPSLRYTDYTVRDKMLLIIINAEFDEMSTTCMSNCLGGEESLQPQTEQPTSIIDKLAQQPGDLIRWTKSWYSNTYPEIYANMDLVCHTFLPLKKRFK